ncbi:hypothetical protein K438DRAFT_1987761 [Mycena galopus ATCC 62051]|nr:hypothetical protein K438DRAFT_1987761 [Mycena galopus ATCC 62051]
MPGGKARAMQLTTELRIEGRAAPATRRQSPLPGPFLDRDFNAAHARPRHPRAGGGVRASVSLLVLVLPPTGRAPMSGVRVAHRYSCRLPLCWCPRREEWRSDGAGAGPLWSGRMRYGWVASAYATVRAETGASPQCRRGYARPVSSAALPLERSFARCTHFLRIIFPPVTVSPLRGPATRRVGASARWLSVNRGDRKWWEQVHLRHRDIYVGATAVARVRLIDSGGSASELVGGASWSYNSSVLDITAVLAKLHDFVDEELTALPPESGAYVNEGIYTYWDPNYERLLAIKTKYDPHGLLDCWRCVGWKGAAHFPCYSKLAQ